MLTVVWSRRRHNDSLALTAVWSRLRGALYVEQVAVHLLKGGPGLRLRTPRYAHEMVDFRRAVVGRVHAITALDVLHDICQRLEGWRS